MNRLALRIRGPQLRALPISTRATAAITAFPIRQYASSAPKEAESASAQSGGSRSKDAAEEHGELETGENPNADRLAGKGAKGRTGGGEALSSSEHPPAQPKINNASVPGEKKKLSKEQQEEVDQHNKEFDEKHDRASPAAEDKVDKQFWKGNAGTSEK